MKKGWLIIALLAFFLIPIARAEIVFDGPHYNSFNLGDNLNLAVTITYPNSLNGLLKASLVCENSSLDYPFYLVPTSLQAGSQKTIAIGELVIQEGMTGNCNVNVELLNTLRQSLEKSQSGKLLISNELRLDSKLSKLNLNAGDSFVVSGSVRNIRSEKIADGSVSLILDGKEHLTPIKSGEFGYEFKLPDDYKSGSHKLTVNAADDKGNRARKDFEFNVEAIPTVLELRFNQESFKPEDLMIIEALLYDQAGDKMNGDALVKLYNPDNDIMLQRTITTDEKIEYNLPKYAAPGSWKVMASSSGLEADNSIRAEVIEKLDFQIDGQKVMLTNIGNVVYQKPIEIFFGEVSSLKKDTSLKPGETAIIDLSKEDIDTGSYPLEVASGDNAKSFGSVDIIHERRSLGESLGLMLPWTGKAVLGSEDDPIINPYYAGLIIIAVAMLGYLGFKYIKKRKRFSEKTKTRQMKEAEMMAREIKSRKEKNPYKYNNEDEKQKALIEYRDRILGDIEKEKKAKEAAERRSMIMNKDNSKDVWQEKEREYEPVKDEVKGEFRYEEKNDRPEDKSFADEEDFKLNSEKKKKNEDESGFFNFFGD